MGYKVLHNSQTSQNSYFRFDFCSLTKDADLGGGVEVELGLVVSHCKVEQFR